MVMSLPGRIEVAATVAYQGFAFLFSICAVDFHPAPVLGVWLKKQPMKPHVMSNAVMPGLELVKPGHDGKGLILKLLGKA